LFKWILAAARAFWAGATLPSAPALAGSLLVCAGLWTLCAVTLDEALVASGRMVTFESDDYAAVAAEALRLRESPAPSPTSVVVISASSTREAISSPDQLADEVARRAGVRGHTIRPVMFTAGAIAPVEALALSDWLPDDFSGVVVIALSARLLGFTADELQALVSKPRLPLRSPTLDAALPALGLTPRGHWSRNFFLDNSSFFLARPAALKSLRGKPPRPRFHQIGGLPDPTPEEWARLARRVRDWLLRYEAGRERNLALYARLAARLQERGAEVAFVQSPRNPDVQARAMEDPAVAAAWETYRADVRRFADEVGAAFWDPGEAVRLAPDEFKDYSHLDRQGARERFTQALAKEIAQRLQRSRVEITASPARQEPSVWASSRRDAPPGQAPDGRGHTPPGGGPAVDTPAPPGGYAPADRQKKKEP